MYPLSFRPLPPEFSECVDTPDCTQNPPKTSPDHMVHLFWFSLSLSLSCALSRVPSLSFCRSLAHFLSPQSHTSTQLRTGLQMSSRQRTCVGSSCVIKTEFHSHGSEAPVIVPQAVEEHVKVLKVLAFATKPNDVPLNSASWNTWSIPQMCRRSQISSDRNSASVSRQTLTEAVAQLRADMWLRSTAGQISSASPQQCRTHRRMIHVQSSDVIPKIQKGNIEKGEFGNHMTASHRWMQAWSHQGEKKMVRVESVDKIDHVSLSVDLERSNCTKSLTERQRRSP